MQIVDDRTPFPLTCDLIFRQSQVGRRVPAIPEDYDDEDEGGYEAPGRYNEEEPSGYGYTRDSNEYVQRRGGGSRRAQGRGDRRGSGESGGGRRGSGERRGNTEYGGGRRESGERRPEVEEGEEIDESGEEEVAEGDCGPECRNLLHESEHPQEDARCPYEGMVIDVWGYCRYFVYSVV